MIEKAKFTYSLLGKTSEKQSKVAGNQGEKQLKAIEDYRKKLVESNALISKNCFSINKDSVLFEKNGIFNQLLNEKTSEHKTDPNNLIYGFKTEGIVSKDFRGYRNPKKVMGR